jgi:dCTP deaminase
MSALGRNELVDALRSEDLVVTPLLGKEQIGASTIDLRMGTVALMVRARGIESVDPGNFTSAGRNDSDSLKTSTETSATDKAASSAILADLHERVRERRQRFDRLDVPFHRKFLLHPGSLALVPTLEWIAIPPRLQGVVTARSTWAREGLSIATATIVNPGYRGTVTLELANLGHIPIKLYAGLRIAQLALYSLSSDVPARYLKSQFDSDMEPKAGILAKDEDVTFLPRPRL